MNTMEKTQPPARDVWLYQPSAIDRFMRYVQRMPVPYWLVYLCLFALQGTLNYAIARSEGWQQPAAFSRIFLIYPMWQWIPLAIMTFLNNTSRKVLTSFRPLLKIDDEELARLKAEFTTLPPRGVLISSLFWLAFYVIINMVYKDVAQVAGLSTITYWVVIAEGALCYVIGSVVYFHSLRQLVLIHRTVKRVNYFNLFALEPVYAFSRLTAWTGISWVLLLGLTFLFFPFVLAPGLMLVVAVIMLIFALAAFALPLRVVNQHLVQGKQALLAEHQRRLEVMLNRFHGHLDQGEMTNMEQFEKAITSLTAERKILESIPTWPWRPATLTGFLSAAVLPVILLLIQIGIERWLSR